MDMDIFSFFGNRDSLAIAGMLAEALDANTT
jgi:hypothetical protein